MAARFLDKESGADTVSNGVVTFVEIIDDATGRAKVRNLPDAAGIVYDKASGFIKYNDAGTIRALVNTDEAQTLTNKTLTSPTITGATLSSTNATLTTPTITSPVVTEATEVVIVTNPITAEETGKTFFLNAATEFASTLPAPAAGLNYTFIVTAAPSTGSYTVVTEGGCQILGGHVLTSDVYTDSAVDADFEAPAAGTTITFVADVSVEGDRAHVISDGTNWYVVASCARVAGITITG